MKANKILVIVLVGIFLMSLGLSITQNEIDGQESGNLTFGGNENVTKNVTIPTYANVTSTGFFPNVTGENWTSFRYDKNNTGFSDNTVPDGIDFAETNFSTGDDVDSTSAIANGYVYAPSNDGTLYQLEEKNFLKQYANFSTNSSFEMSSPTYHNGYIYVGSNNNKVYQLNASNVSQKVHEYETNGNVTPSPLVTDKYVYIGSDDNRFYQLNSSNVSQKIGEFNTGTSVDSSASINNGSVYVGTSNGALYRFNASNISRGYKQRFITNDQTDSSPVIANGYVYVGSTDNYVYQLDDMTLNKVQQFETGNDVYSSPAVTEDYVYIGSDDNNVYQLNASNISDQEHNFSTSGDVTSSPIVMGDSVYIGSEGDTLYRLDRNRISKKLEEFSTGGAIESSPSVANGYLYIGSNDNSLYQLRSQRSALKLIGRQRVVDLVNQNATTLGYYNNRTGFTDNTAPNDISMLYSESSPAGAIKSSPAVYNETVFVGSDDGNFYSFNVSNVSQSKGTYSAGSDIRSSPTLDNGFAYFGSQDNKVYKINANQMVVNSSYDTGDDVDSSPLVTGSSVYIGNDNGTLYKFDKSDMSVQQKFQTGSEIHSAPTIDGSSIYLTAINNKTYRLDTSLNELESHTASGEISSAPSTNGNYTYVADEGGTLYQLNASNVSDEINSVSPGGQIRTSPSLNNKYVFVASDNGNLYRYNKTDLSSEGSINIHQDDSTNVDIVFSKASVTNNTLYIGSFVEDFLSPHSEYLTQLDINQTMSQDKQFSISLSSGSGDLMSSPSIANNYAFMGSRDGRLYQLGNLERVTVDSNITNPYLEVGNPDGDREWNVSGQLTDSNSPNGAEEFSDVLNRAINGTISSCPEGTKVSGNPFGNCKIPFLFHSDTEGVLEFLDFQIEYELLIYPRIELKNPPINFSNQVPSKPHYEVGTPINFSANLTDPDTGIENVSLMLNGSRRQSDSSGGVKVYNFTDSKINPNYWEWQYKACDEGANISDSNLGYNYSRSSECTLSETRDFDVYEPFNITKIDQNGEPQDSSMEVEIEINDPQNNDMNSCIVNVTDPLGNDVRLNNGGTSEINNELWRSDSSVSLDETGAYSTSVSCTDEYNNTYTDSQNLYGIADSETFNYSAGDSQDNTRKFAIPKDANVTSSTIDMEGIATVTKSQSTTQSWDEFMNEPENTGYDDHQVKGSFSTTSSYSSAEVVAGPIVTDGYVYFGDLNNNIYQLYIENMTKKNDYSLGDEPSDIIEDSDNIYVSEHNANDFHKFDLDLGSHSSNSLTPDGGEIVKSHGSEFVVWDGNDMSTVDEDTLSETNTISTSNVKYNGIDVDGANGAGVAIYDDKIYAPFEAQGLNDDVYFVEYDSSLNFQMLSNAESTSGGDHSGIASIEPDGTDLHTMEDDEEANIWDRSSGSHDHELQGKDIEGIAVGEFGNDMYWREDDMNFAEGGDTGVDHTYSTSNDIEEQVLPVVNNHNVFVTLQNGKILKLDEGDLTFQDDVTLGDDPANAEVTGMAISNGYLFVPTQGGLYRLGEGNFDTTNHYPENPELRIDDTDTQVWSKSGELQSTVQTPDFTSDLNDAINGSAESCPQGTIEGDYCVVDFDFNQDNDKGAWRYKNINIQYSRFLGPEVTLKEPKDGFNTSTKNTTFSADINDENSAVQNASLKVDSTITQTNTSGAEGTYKFEENLSYGDHIWSIESCDPDNNCTESSARSISVYENFSIENLTPSNENIQLAEETKLDLNLSGGQNNVMQSCNFNLTAPSGYKPISTNGTRINKSTWDTNQTTINETGTYNAQVDCTDEYGHTYSESTSFDTNYQFNYTPKNKSIRTYQEANETVKFNVSFYDNSTGDINYSLSADIENSSNFSTNLNPSYRILNDTDSQSNKVISTFSINASSNTSGKFDGNISISNSTFNQEHIVNFTFDVMTFENHPDINSIKPSDKKSVADKDVNFSADISDPNSGISNVSLLIDGNITQTNSSGLETDYNFTENLDYGDYNWSIESCDTGGNCTESRPRKIYVHQDFTVNSLQLTNPDVNLAEKTRIKANLNNPENNKLQYLDFNTTNEAGGMPLNSQNGTRLSKDEWNSDEFEINDSGDWNISVLGEDEYGNKVNLSDNFTIVYSLTNSPTDPFNFSAQNESQAYSTGKTYNITAFDNTGGEINYTIVTAIEESQNFTINTTPGYITLDDSDSQSNVKSSEFFINATNGTEGQFQGNITLSAPDYDEVHTIDFTYAINPPSGVATIYPSGTATQKCSPLYTDVCANDYSFNPGDTATETYAVENTGEYNLTGCTLEGTNDFVNQNWISFNISNFNLSIGERKTVEMNIDTSNVNVGDYKGYIQADCPTDALAGFGKSSTSKDSDSSPFLRTLISSPTPTPPTGGAGGGGAPDVVTQDVVALVAPDGVSEYTSALERAKLYKAISDYCENNQVAGVCSLDEDDLESLTETLSSVYNIDMDVDTAESWVRQFRQNEIENVELTQTQIDEWNLITAQVQEPEGDFAVTPERFDRFFIAVGERFSSNIDSNRLLRSCSISEGDVGFSCSSSGASATLSYEIPEEADFTFQVVEATATYVDVNGNTINQEIRLRVIRPSPLLFIILFAVIGGLVLIYLNRKKVRESLGNFRKRIFG